MMTIIMLMQVPSSGGGLPGWVAPISMLALAGGLIGVGVWIGAVNTNMKNFKDGLAELAKEIRDDIKKILGRLPATIAEGQSPLRLNDLGKAVSKEIAARTWADRLIPTVAKRLEGNEAFEIQDFCFLYVTDLEYSEEEARAIKKSAYDNAISVEQVRRVLAIELRDKLLAIADLDAP